MSETSRSSERTKCVVCGGKADPFWGDEFPVCGPGCAITRGERIQAFMEMEANRAGTSK